MGALVVNRGKRWLSLGTHSPSIMFRELSVSEPSESVMMVPMVETVMWVQREKKMFPRWKERVVVITGEELYCYKKGSAQLSDVGSLVFKVTWPYYNI